MGEKNRIKTGTNREKALFFFLVIIVIAGVLMSYQVFNIIDTTAASTGTTQIEGNNSTNQSSTKTYINVQVQVDDRMLNKNISIKNGPNESNIVVTEV